MNIVITGVAGLVGANFSEYILKNKERLLKRKKEYYLNNKKIINEKNKEYRLKNKELIREKSKKYYFENGGKEAPIIPGV